MSNTYFCYNCMGQVQYLNGRCPECGCDHPVFNKPHQLPVETILNARYLVGRVLGEGGFGITYLGYDLKLNTKVAIKEYFLSGGVSRTKAETVTPVSAHTASYFNAGREKFLSEAKMLARFMHEANIVSVRDYFLENNTAYIVMEYLQGQNFNDYFKSKGPISFDELFTMLEPVMRSLDKMHKEGLIHRDISPANIMLLKNGGVKLLDFGTAREQSLSGEHSLSVMLKPGFAPEEQYRTHGQQGPWTDVYAFCATIYKLICGRTPDASTDRIFSDQLKPPSAYGAKISPEQESVLMKGLAVNASDRYQSMEQLRSDFEKGRIVKIKKKKNKKGPIIGVSVAAAVLIVASAGIFILSRGGDASTGHSNGKEAAGSHTEQVSAEKTPEYVTEQQYLCVKEVWENVDGRHYSTGKMEYNKFGQCVHETIYTDYYSQSISKTEYIREYDEYGTLIRMKCLNGDEKYSFIIEYDPDNHDIRYEYDLQGNLKGWTENVREGDYLYIYNYFPDGSPNDYVIVYSSEKGDTKENVNEQYNSEGELTYITTSVYDGDGNRLSMVSESVGSYQSRTEETYSYDSEGRVTSAKRVSYSEYSGGEVFTGSFEYELFDVLVEVE